MNNFFKLAAVCLVVLSCTKKVESSPNMPEDGQDGKDIAAAAVTTPVIPSGKFLITNYGASISSADNAIAIQKAITAAFDAGGGTVVIPSGTFKSGPLKLRNNVALEFSTGSILKSLAYANYPGAGTTSDVAALIDLSGLTNAKISGPGVIDGQGQEWWTAYSASKKNGSAIARPGMIGLTSANTIEISDIKILNAPNNHIGIGKKSNNITISKITLESPENSPNTDGIGVWGTNINILDCNISCGDDNIAINSNAKYINIKGCTFGKGHGLAIGSYASNIDHVTVDDCIFNGTGNGVRIKSNRTRSGTLQYITYSNIVMTNVANPFFICQYYPDNTIPSTPSGDVAQPVTETTPVWKHLTFKNITVTGADKAGIIWAVPEKPMVNLVFENVKITAKVGMIANYVNGATFKDGSSISVGSGSAMISTYGSKNILGINHNSGVAQ